MRALALLAVAAFATVPALAFTQAEDSGTATAPVTETQVKTDPADPENRVRCRRVEVTGSLVKRGRVCRTVREWRTIAENGNYNARKMVEDSTSKQGGN